MSLHIAVNDLLYAKEDILDESEYYYLCEYKGGELTNPTFAEEEGEEQLQFYTPLWIPLAEIDELVLYPESVKEILLDGLRKDK
jgi:hypothetical protein